MMTRALSHLPLRFQIGSLVVLAGLILAICAGVVWVATAQVQRAEMRKDRESSIGRHAALLEAALLSARRTEHDFLDHRETKYVVRHDEAVAETRAALDAIDAVLPDGDARREQVGTVRRGVANYDQTFHQTVELETAIGLDEKDGLLGTLRDSAHNAELALKEQDDLRLMVILLMLRRHEKDFLAHHDSLYADQFAEASAQFAEMLNYVALDPAARAAIRDRMDAYQRNFQTASTAVLTAGASVNAMGDIYTGIAPTIREVGFGAQLRANAAQASADRTQTVTSRVIAGTLILGLLATLWLGTIIARSIHRPLSVLTETMQSLAGGRLDVTIPAGARNNEVSRMAHSLTIFRSAMADAERARQAMEEERRRSEGEKLASLEAMAYVDGLTGLANRRHFDQALATEIRRAHETGGQLSLLMVDIDYFKRVNDTYGHGGGDAVLKHVGHLLREEARRTDLPARYGGEEFAIILPATGKVLTRLVAERLRATVEETPFDLGEGRMANLSISIGVATLAADDVAVTLAERADAALYRAKQRGRNRVEEWSEAAAAVSPQGRPVEESSVPQTG